MKRNVILITIDALRADHVSCYGYNRVTTPALDELANDGLLFENAYSASSHTREAVPALLTGRYPTEAVDEDFSRGAETIPLQLPDDYATAAFHSNPYLSRPYGYDKGFNHFDDDLRLGQNRFIALLQRAVDKFLLNRGEYHARAEEINERSLSWLQSADNKQPFFLWNHYMDVHGPYNPPEDYSKWTEPPTNVGAQRLYDRLSGTAEVSPEDERRAIDLYDGEIRYTDKRVREFIDALDSRGLLENSLVVITSDHGDLFGEYGKYAHPRQVYPELTRVPLLVTHPDKPGDTVTTPVSTLDIAPTILDSAGETYSDLTGETLLEPEILNEDRLVFSSATGEDGGKKRKFAVQGERYGYRFTRNVDSGELTDEVSIRLPDGTEIDSVDSGDSAKLEKQRKELLEHSRTHLGAKLETDSDRPVGSEIEDRLEALGYK
jgi:arylsulfatase